EMFDEEDDGEFAELFSAFDEVVVTAEQRKSALEYVLANEEPKLSRAATGAHMRRPVRRKASRVRLGVIAACLVVVIAGVASWMLPISSVEVTSDNYAVKLGMNVFGVAVTAQAEDELGQEVLNQTDIRNMGSDDARERLQETFERLYPELTPEVKEDTKPENANTPGTTGSAGNASVQDPSDTPGMMANNSAAEASSAQQQQGVQVVINQTNGQLVMADPQNWDNAQEDGGNNSSVQPSQQQTVTEQQQQNQTYQMDQPNEGDKLEQQSQPGHQQGEPPQQDTQQENDDKSASATAEVNEGSPSKSDDRQSNS
ncbi:MAG: hypothetical protein Q4B54_05930, partial [Coriobacteriales bacterium]|nr:hypothetical protein [Coriobacteriales bacterium]